MLKLRVITALVLLPIVLAALFLLERTAFAAVAGVFFLAAAWEWSALVGGLTRLLRVGYVALMAVLLAAAEHYQPLWLFHWAPLWWLLAAFWVLRYPRSTALWSAAPVMALIGAALLVPSFAVVVAVQDQGALGLAGPWALLFMLFWVWAADTGAYFAGRTLGKHKLAPAVSPGKTIEGLIGGVLLALVIVALVHHFAPVQAQLPKLLAVALVTVLASVLGDLFESMVKRLRGVKDSGTMLPGHGGMLDRIDSITAALPVAAMALLWAGLAGV